MIELPGLPGGMPCEDCEQGISTCCLTPDKPDRHFGPLMPDRVGLSEATKEYVGPSVVHLRVSLSDGSYPSASCGWLNSLGQWWSGDPAEVTCFDCMGGSSSPPGHDHSTRCYRCNVPVGRCCPHCKAVCARDA